MQKCVILNPQAGGGKAGAVWRHIAPLLEDVIGEFELFRTEAPMDATHLVRKAISDGAELIVAVGGDGTLNEVVNGFLDSNGQLSQVCALALVPCGTGTDFGRTLGLANDPTAAISRISKDAERVIDVGVASFHSNEGALASRLFLNIASFGLSGAINRRTERAVRLPFLPIRWTYLMETLLGLRSYNPANVRLSIDGTVIEREIMFVAIANARYFGGGMMVAPDADLCDGLLDIVVLNKMSKVRLARNIPLVFRGTHAGLLEVETFRAVRIIAETQDETNPSPIYLEVDGENTGFLNCEFTVQANALRLWQ